MNIQQFRHFRHEGISNWYYAGGRLCIYKPKAPEVDYTVYLFNEIHTGTLEHCEQVLFENMAPEMDFNVDDALDFEPFIELAGHGTLAGMADLLVDYCGFFSLTDASADELAADPANEAHRDWLLSFVKSWDEIEEACGEPVTPDSAPVMLDLTPTWSGVLVGLLHTVEHGTTQEIRDHAMRELVRMARVADSAVALTKAVRT